MAARTSLVIRWLAWSLAALGIGIAAAGRALELVNDEHLVAPIAGAFVGIAFLIVGALIASRRPRNPLGWLYLLAMTLVAFGGNANLADQYAYYALVTRPGSLPAPDWVIWSGELTLSVGFYALVTFGLLLFPDGRLPSPRWRLVAGAVLVGLIVSTAGGQLAPGPMRPAFDVSNPVGLSGVAGLNRAALGASLLVVLLPFLGCVASVFVRFRRATGRERQQLKWFAYGAAWIPAVALIAALLAVVAPTVLDGGLGAELWPLSLAGIPIATGVAVLRHRLYDIDVLIERTLVYGATTAAIGVAFFSGIVLLQAAVRPLTGGSELAVAGSTLLCFALFQPIRRRVQSTVDRRFYRARYDAGRTVDTFTEELAGEVELDAVRASLLAAVGQTLQPTSASVWLRRNDSRTVGD